MIKFIQVGGHLFIGDIQPERPDMLITPRLVLMIPVKPGVMSLNFTLLIGEPKEIEIHEWLYSYDVTDNELLSRYIEVTTDIVIMPSSGVGLN